MTKSGTNYVYADSDTYTFNVFMRGGVVFTILGVGFGGSLGIDVTSVFGVDSSATLRANACVVILKVRYCATATIATIAIPTTIFPDQPPPQLATMNSGGTLRLNVGDTASERTVSTEGADEDYEIRQVGGNATNGYTIKVLAFGYAEEYRCLEYRS
ncbi:MAG: hypothetical protein DRQ45_08340 [Gammaproteobacteria bacterium]|nr:MAG: hypothetical protein DRQ45_08340 [Gammaproteobacteria bacterium]